jgi:ribonuclease Z
MNFSVTILGSGAAIPTPDRNPTAHLIEVRNQLLLLDCGEGTQMQLRKSGVKIQKLSHILISHLHGDHYFGLIGLVNTLHLLGRTQELHLYGISPLKQLIDLQLELSRTTLAYPLIFHPFETEKPAIILDDAQYTVTTIPLDHRVPTCGFLIKEKPEKRKIRKDFIKNVKVPFQYFERIKDGEDYTDEQGNIYLNHLITDDPPPVRSYAYCTDTAYHEPIIPIIKNCDLLYHEATFMEDKAADAHAKFHSTAREAATIAKKAGVKKLVIGHFSARYKEVESLLGEAREVFPETILAEDGITIQV